MDEQYQELARRLAAAAISTWMGISLQHQYDKLKDQEIGAYWIDLAKQVTEHMTHG